MKIAVIGGGGVRMPFLAKSLAQKAARLGIDTFAFADSDARKLNIFGKLAVKVCEAIDSNINVTLTTDIADAVTDADYVITAIRAGGDSSRAIDERIALNHGVLGQETTGAGGFAMAIRSIPVLAGYMELIKKFAKPDAKVFNFTNPSGLVTQALYDRGYHNVYGICDGPSEFIKEIENMLGVPFGSVEYDLYGLNHLGWFDNIRLGGKEITAELLANDELYKRTEMRFFDKEFARYTQRLFNGYLYYYYSRENAVSNILKSEYTRGETIEKINTQMIAELQEIDIDKDFEKAYGIFISHYNQRENNYMAIESGTQRELVRSLDLQSLINAKNDDGYAGVALQFIDSHINNTQARMTLIVPNNGTIDFLKDEDTIEASCIIDRTGATPVKPRKIGELEENLIRQMKLFERLTIEAIRERSVLKANVALSVHPLINSYSLAKTLVSEYLTAHSAYIEEWK